MDIFKKEAKTTKQLSEREILERKVDEMMSLEFDDSKKNVAEESLESSQEGINQPVKNEFQELDQKLKDLNLSVEEPKNVEENKIPLKVQHLKTKHKVKPQALDKKQVVITKDNLDDHSVDKAVDQIVNLEAGKPSKKRSKKSLKLITAHSSINTNNHRHWKIKLFCLFLLIILVLLAIPVTRYKITSFFFREEFTVEVVNRVNNLPISDSLVSIGDQEYYTNQAGLVSFTLGPGPYQITVTRQGYSDYQKNILVGLKAPIIEKISLKTYK